MGGTTATTVVAAVALGCQRLAGLAVELAVELAVALGARSVLEVVGNHLHCECGDVPVCCCRHWLESTTALHELHWHFANVEDYLHCLMKMIFRQRLDSPPLVLQLRQRRLTFRVFRQRLKSTALVGGGVVLWNHLYCHCGHVVSVDVFWDHLLCLMKMTPTACTESTVLQLRQRLEARLLLRSYNMSLRTGTSSQTSPPRHVLQLCLCLDAVGCRGWCRQRLA